MKAFSKQNKATSNWRSFPKADRNALISGLPHGPCWIAREGQGWLHGEVDNRGRMTGDNISFVYPDLSTCLLGTFHEEQLVSGSPSQVSQVSLASVTSPVVSLGFCQPTLPPSLRTYSHSPSDRQRIACDWQLADCYESVTVICKPSDISVRNCSKTKGILLLLRN